MTEDNIINIDDFIKQNNEEKFEDEVLEPIKGYKIPRNDPCPCGSGKKYKKCCAKVQPKESLEHYYDELYPYLSNFEDLNYNQLRVCYEIARNADNDYPIEPTISEFAGVVSYTLSYFDKTEEYLMKHYNIVKDDIADDTLFYLIDTLNELGRYKKSEEILDEICKTNDNIDLLLLLTETKFALGKIEEGYQYANKTYKISGENIEVLNLNLKLFVKNKLYNQAFPVIKENYIELEQLDGPENVISLVELMIETVFLIDQSEINNRKQYLDYLDKIINIIQFVEPSKKLKKGNVNKIKGFIDENYDIGFFLVRLFYTIENYEWIAKNEDILLEITELKEIILDSIYDANYQEKNYQYLVDNISKTYQERFKKTSSVLEIINNFNYYLNSLYEVKDDKKTKEMLTFIDHHLKKDTFLFIESIFSKEENIRHFNLLNYLKSVDKYEILDKKDVLEVLLTLLIRDMKFINRLEMSTERIIKVKNILTEYEKLHLDSFVYHYTKWLLTKLDNNGYDYTIDEIIKMDCHHVLSAKLKYMIIFKFSEQEYILKNSPEKDLFPKEQFNLLFMLAKFINGEIGDIEDVFNTYPDKADYIFSILDQVLDHEKKQKIFNKYI